MPTAQTILDSAGKIMQERGKEYDCPNGERSMAAAITAFNAITRYSLAEADGWLLMQILKDVRQWRSLEYHRDSAEDCAAYAALKAEALSRGVDDCSRQNNLQRSMQAAEPHAQFVSALSGGVYPKVPGNLYNDKFIPRPNED